MIAICRDHAANVKRWRDGQMVLRWIAAAMDEARRQFRRESSRPHRTLDTKAKPVMCTSAAPHGCGSLQCCHVPSRCRAFRLA